MLFHKKQITAFLDISSVNKPNKYLAFLCEEEAQSKQGGFLQEATILALSWCGTWEYLTYPMLKSIWMFKSREIQQKCLILLTR